MMLNMNFDHIVNQTTKKIKAQIMKINNLFEIKMITSDVSDSMNKTVNLVTSNHASEFIIIKT